MVYRNLALALVVRFLPIFLVDLNCFLVDFHMQVLMVQGWIHVACFLVIVRFHDVSTFEYRCVGIVFGMSMLASVVIHLV